MGNYIQNDLFSIEPFLVKQPLPVLKTCFSEIDLPRQIITLPHRHTKTSFNSLTDHKIGGGEYGEY